jgi:FkbM family methyltransferase
MLVRKYFHDSLNTIDLGASLGIIACEILGHLKKGQLISVEADPELCKIARTNIDLNFPHSDAEVINAAVTSEAEAISSIQFGRPLSGHLGTLSGHSDVISVPAVTLPKIIEKFGNESFQLSCDIEGSEIPLFLHSTDAFKNCELMMVELHDSAYNGDNYTPQHVATIVEEKLAMKKHFQRDNVYLFVRTP